eukprot:8421256-Pyramimonas_sp.AAC.1
MRSRGPTCGHASILLLGFGVNSCPQRPGAARAPWPTARASPPVAWGAAGAPGDGPHTRRGARGRPASQPSPGA